MQFSNQQYRCSYLTGVVSSNSRIENENGMKAGRNKSALPSSVVESSLSCPLLSPWRLNHDNFALCVTMNRSYGSSYGCSLSKGEVKN